MNRARILEFAARPCGTNTPELVELGADKNAASGTLANLVTAGRLFRVDAEVTHQGVVVAQYFAHQEDAAAWARLAPTYRPNMRLRASSRSSTSGPNRRAREKPPAPVAVQRPMWVKTTSVGAPVPRRIERPASLVPVIGPSQNHDPRYQIDPATFQGGEFARRGVGNYGAEPGCCAARAVRA